MNSYLDSAAASVRILAAVTAALLASCTTFSNLDPPAQGGGEVDMASQCTVDEVPVAVSSSAPIASTTVQLASNVGEVGQCGLFDTSGPEGFLAIDVLEGDRWHIFANAQEPEADLSLYALGNCDAARCVAGVNACPAGDPERLNFRATTSERRYIGVDTTVPSDVSVIVERSECGNGELERTETCDDGNASDEDNCGRGCRRLFRPGGASSTEIEPNDSALQENVLLFNSAGLAQIKGTLSGSCDLDRYAVSVPDGTTLQATVLEVNETPCDDVDPPVTLRYVNPASQAETTEGIVDPESMNNCPVLANEPLLERLAAGEYHFIVQTPAEIRGTGGTQFAYTLQIEIQ